MPKIIDPKTFWRLIGERATGATVVTARGADGPAGFLGLSAAHVCADPPTMLVSIDAKTSALAAVLHGKHFAINYLRARRPGLADLFGGKTAVKGADRFEPGILGHAHHRRAGAQGRSRHDRLHAGKNHRAWRDHHRHRPRRRLSSMRDGGEPLVFFRGTYLD